ncbi:unnamed protein product [Rhizoctonia solani]|uniref:3-phytase A n=1 Tax=Rhizoctonia solani TaxID=456999 RepID=A0A8H2X7N0_9AGAM|nr:unnamed protein product [Rhizoctonia solani]
MSSHLSSTNFFKSPAIEVKVRGSPTKPETHKQIPKESRIHEGHTVRNRVVAAALLTAASILYFQTQYQPLGFESLQVELDAAQSNLPILPAYGLDPSIAHNLGPYSARYTVPGNISSSLPVGCKVSMINVLQRHGARYPTNGTGEEIKVTLEKLKKVQAQDVIEPSLKFVSTFDYSFIPEQLVEFGRLQNFVRAANKPRIVESSQWWKQGFEGKPFDVAQHNLVKADLTIPIGKHARNPLNMEKCPTQEKKDSSGDQAKKDWLPFFVPNITGRLNRYLPGAFLEDSDIISLMNLCGFDTAAKDGKASPWCSVFTDDEWKSYEYYHDLEKYYANSYGSIYAPSLGAGWVNELLARLTDKPVEDHTTTDPDLDKNPDSFPIGSDAPRVFADFSSDNSIMKIIAALGILRDHDNLPRKGPIPSSQQMVVSKVVPFAGSMVVEKITCSARTAYPLQRDYVRILINDAAVPLLSCGTRGRTFGMCSLDAFIESQAFARGGGNFELCFGKRPSTSQVHQEIGAEIVALSSPYV